jgi:hypothetical protein
MKIKKQKIRSPVLFLIGVPQSGRELPFLFIKNGILLE